MIRSQLQKRAAGFTMIEIIVVIAVISILAGSMAPMISQRIDAAREDGTQIKMQTLRKALLAYAGDTGRFPREKKKGPDSLAALEEGGKKPPSGWRGPYLVGTYASRDYTRDAWNSAYQYRIDRLFKNAAPQVILTSLGPDRTRGTQDDIVLTIAMPLEDVSERIARTRARLKLIEGNIYNQRTEGAPQSYKVPRQWEEDAWGRIIRYRQYNEFSAVVYSTGPNGIDDGLAKDDLYRAMVWSPKVGPSSPASGKRSSSGTGKRKDGKQNTQSSSSATTRHGDKNRQSSGVSGRGTPGKSGASTRGRTTAASDVSGRTSGRGGKVSLEQTQGGGKQTQGGGKRTQGGGEQARGGSGGSASSGSRSRGRASRGRGLSGASQTSGVPRRKEPLSSAGILKLSPSAISSVSSEQIALMSKSDFNRLSLKQKVMLTHAQLAERKRADAVRARKYHQFKDVPASQIKYLSEKQMTSIPNTWWLKSLSRKQRMALSKKQIQALNTRKIAIDALPESKRAFLTQKQVQDIQRYDYFKYLDPGKISQLTTKQVSTIPNGWWMNSLSRKQKMALSRAQIQALNTGKVSISALPEEKRKHLTTSQIQSVKSYGDFRYLDPAQVAQLKPEQIGTIPNSWWMNTLSRKQREALTEAQVQKINTQKVSIEPLPEGKRALLKTAQIRNIGNYSDYRYLAPGQITKLTRGQIKKIPNSWWMNTLSKQQKQMLTERQVKAINTKKVTIDSLPANKREYLSTEQVQDLTRYSDFRYLPPDKIPSLTPQQIGKIPNNWWMNRFSSEQMHRLTIAQVRAIRPAYYRKIENRLTSKQRKWRSQDG